MCRVLILDDDPEFAKLIKLIIETAEEGRPDVTTNEADGLAAATRAVRRGRPYEVFLIDQRLGPGKDGIEVLKDLRRISPDSDAIIFTGYQDTENGLRAYEAGAFRYLSKPFENRELLYLLKSVKQWRKEIREHNWQKIFGQMMEETLRKSSFQEVAATVVKYALKLNFERAHLFWVPRQEDANPDNEMIGITSVGHGCIRNFGKSKTQQILYPLNHWFDLMDAREALFVRPDEAQELAQQAAGYGYKWPAGENVILPLRSNTRLLGALILDYGQLPKAPSDHDRLMLNFFARQVSLALENASLYIQEKRAREETDIISTVGQHVSRLAASNDLAALIEDVRMRVGKLMDTSNLAMILCNEETNELEVHRIYAETERYEFLRRPAGSGLEGYLIQHQIGIPPVLDVPEYIRLHDIVVKGRVPTHWMGAPLIVADKMIGAITLQHFGKEEKYTKRNWQLWVAVANQIAGAIQLSHLNETEKHDVERLNVLRRATAEMLRVAQRNEDDLWLTTATIATANFGTGFNRALLFLENPDHTALVLKTAIGTDDSSKAHHDWERDEKRQYQFEDFLLDLEQGTVTQTDFAELAGSISIPLNASLPDALNEVLRTSALAIVKEKEFSSRLPAELTGKVQLSECAIVPLRAGNRTIGLMVVDNKHNKITLKQPLLYRLQTILGYAGLVKETLRQQEKSESLLDANYQIISGANHETLRDTLKRICETARTITEADWVIVYPYKEGETVFDVANVGYAGDVSMPLEEVIIAKPSKKGMSHYVLTKGELVIKNIDTDKSKIIHHLHEQHFIKKENVKALIGIAIKDVLSDQTLGLLYLDYRQARAFTEQEIHHARSFASLAAVAINNARRFDQERQHKRLQAAQEVAEVISTELNLDLMLVKALEKLQQFFGETSMCVLTYEENDKGLRFAPATLKYYHAPRAVLPENRIFPLDGPSLVCKAAREAIFTGKSEPVYEPDVSQSVDYLRLIPRMMSELCISLLSSKPQLLGVLALERAAMHGFSDEDIALVETVARQISLGMERARQSEQLTFKEAVAAHTAWAADIAHDIKNEVGIIKGSIYFIREFAANLPDIQEYINEIEKSTENLAQADPQKGKNKQVLLVDDLIHKFGNELAHAMNVNMAYKLNTDHCYINVSPFEFKRMLKHLTRNAVKAMDGGSEKKIIIHTQKVDKKNLEIQFQDFGPGVKDEVQPFLFLKRTTTKRSEESGGHGLLFTRQSVEEMGGSIRLLRSAPGQGATFSISLPVYDFPESLPE